MKKIRMGVVGVGSLGQHHVRILSELEKVDLVGIADINEKRVREIASLYQIPFYTTNYKELMDKIDAVSIVTPTSTHFSIAKDFLERGIHIFVEKPVTQYLWEVEELLDLAGGKDLVFQVGHIERFNPAIQELKKYIKDPLYIEAHRMGYYSGKPDDVGVVLDLMIHDLDILFYLLGKDKIIKDIHGVGYSIVTPFEDFVNVSILFEGGILANLTASRVSSKKFRKLDIQEKDGTYITVDYINQSITITCLSNRVVDPSVESPVFEKEEPLKLELEQFINCIIKGESPLVTLEDGKLAVALATEILKEIEIYRI
ncbi:MAG: oxidoreductase [Dictyoglomus sp. NZ13-RE01]|nr:MAG: oxidoreductase [Dictyoglomus sp. NZ13-RE01]